MSPHQTEPRERYQLFSISEPMGVGERRHFDLPLAYAFRPMRIVLPPGHGEFFLMHPLRIEGEDQFVSGGAIPASVFDAQAVGVSLALPTMAPGQVLSLEVERVPDRLPRLVRFVRRWLRIDSPYSKNFTAGILGVAIEVGAWDD